MIGVQLAQQCARVVQTVKQPTLGPSVCLKVLHSTSDVAIARAVATKGVLQVGVEIRVLFRDLVAPGHRAYDLSFYRMLAYVIPNASFVAGLYILEFNVRYSAEPRRGLWVQKEVTKRFFPHHHVVKM
jgi:hypothetical protein